MKNLLSKLSSTDRKLIATGAGFYGGGYVADKATGGGSTPVALGSDMSKGIGGLAFGYVGNKMAGNYIRANYLFGKRYAKGIAGTVGSTLSSQSAHVDSTVAKAVARGGRLFF